MTFLRRKQDTITAEHPTVSAPQPDGLRLVGAFKLFKGLVLFAVGIGAVRLLHNGATAELEHWADMFRVDPDNFYLRRVLEKFSTFDDQKLKALGVGTFFYSALLLTEGCGLLLKKRWAEYFSIIVTASFIPLEIYEIAKRISAPRIFVLLTNIAIVVYLAIVLRSGRARS